jgi:hypothetical protein
MLYNRRSQNVELDLGNLVLNSLGAPSTLGLYPTLMTAIIKFKIRSSF